MVPYTTLSGQTYDRYHRYHRYHRYYHLYKQNELYDEIKEIKEYNYDIIMFGYERGNWYATIKKI
jgi:hypothetical protein